MKKTLLFFLLLFTTIFYAQVSNIEHCAGETAFDLTARQPLLIGNLNPAETTVSYHLSLANANSNTNALSDPTYFIARTSSTTIYARINNNGSFTTNYFNLIINNYLSVTPKLTPIACNGRTADLTINVSGGSGSYKYSLNGSAFGKNNVFLGLLPGMKNFQVIDAITGCTGTLDYNITEPAPMAATAVVNKNTITINASGGTKPYQYSIDGDHFKSSNVFTDVLSGNYNIRVIDVAACSVFVSATVVPPLTSTAIISKPLDCLGSGTASITVNGMGGKTPYTYSLDGVNYQSSNIFDNLKAGTYAATVKDAENNISNTSSIKIQPSSTIAITWTTTNVSCSGSSDGLAAIEATGGVAPYTYSINDGPFSTRRVFARLSATNYTIAVKDAVGCIAKSSITIPQADPIVITENIVNSSVNNDGSITLNALGGSNSYLYALKDDVGNTLRPQQVSNVFSGLPVGPYQVEVTDFRGCFMSKNVAIAALSTLAASVTVGNITCDNLKGSITIAATGGVPPYQYSINNGITYRSLNVFNSLDIQSYSVKVRDAQNTIIGTTAIVTQATSLIVTAKTEAASIQCNGDKTGSITATATGGLQPYKYSIDGTTFQSGKSFYDLAAGSYTITVKDTNGCLASTTISVTQLPSLSATAQIVNDQNLVIIPTGGTTYYTYYLENTTTGIQLGPQTVGTFTKLPVGIYTAKTLDSNGCNFNITGINIQTPSSNALSALSIVNHPGCGYKGRITVEATGGKAPYQYSIDNGTNYSSTNVFTDLFPGTYTVKVRDAELNTTTHSAILKVASRPTLNAVITNVGCKGSSTGSIKVLTDDKSSPYQFSLNGGRYANSATFNNLSAGTYNISVRDSNSCESTLTVVVTEPDALTAIALPSANQGIVANVSGGTAPYSYSLENQNGTIAAPPQSSNTFVNLPIGLYTLKVIDAKACSMSVSNINVIVSTPLSVTTIATNVTCSSTGGTITFNATGGIAPYQYSIDNGANYSLSNIFNNLTPGTYSLKAKDALNTVINLNADVARTTSLKVSAQVLAPINCNGDNSGLIFCSASDGTNQYEYSIDGSKFQSSRNFTNLKAGTYTITVKDSGGCLAVSSPVTLVDPPVLSATAVANKQNIFITPTGGNGYYTYYLENTATGVQLGPIDNGKFTALAPGTYTAKTYDYRGCNFNISGIKIEASTALAVVAIASNITCSNNNNGRVTITATGGVPPYQYSLNNGDTYSSSNLFVNLSPYTYPVKVRDADLNVVTDSVTINSISYLIKATAVVTEVSCQGYNNGIITVTPTGGKAPYNYSLNGGTGNSNTFYDLKAGTYAITVQDQNSCSYKLNVVVKEPKAVNMAITIGANQSIIANVVGGTAPYSYTLEDQNGTIAAPAQTSNIFTNVPLGSYTLRVTDINTCGAISNINLDVASTLLATATTTSPTCVNPLGTINITATGGIGPYQYSLDKINYVSSNIFNLAPGTYTITVRDANNNLRSIVAGIKQLSVPSVLATVTSNVLCKGNNTGAITANATGGQAPYTYSIDNISFNATNTFANLEAGTYTITVKDANGCTATAQAIITEPLSALNAVITVKNQTITINTSGGTGEIKYALSPNLDKFSTNNVFSALTPGSYTVLVRDTKGCSVLMELLVDPPAPLIEGQNKLTIEFKPGQTLADLIIDGQNIKWYISQNLLAGKNKANETPLPLTTALVDGTTYYASQTINGVESKERLAVTAKSNGSLSTPDFILPNFKYYPNPVKHLLTINNTSVIDEIEIYSVSGASVLSKKIDNDRADIDLSNVSSGLYFLKVKAEGQVKIVKLVKK